MDRKMSVIVYSTYSSGCKQLIEYIKSLHYDFMAITGTCLLCADSDAVRDKLYEQNILEVPCMLLQTIDGNNTILNTQDLYMYIDTVSNSILSRVIPQQRNAVESVKTIPVDIPNQNTEIPIVDRTAVSSLAMDMIKARESAEPEHPNPLKRTQLFS